MGTATRKAQRRADKIKALGALVGTADASAARKEKLRMASSWTRRGDREGAFYKASNEDDRSILRPGRNSSHLRVSF